MNTDVARRDAFGRDRIPSFSRRSGIVVPDDERSTDTRECDDLSRRVECLVEDGYAACFECAETRLSLRVCTHVDEAINVIDAGREITLRPNTSERTGYCLRESLARQLRATNVAIGRAKHECNARNGHWLLVRKRSARDSTFQFICRCKYPHLMTNAAGPTSACSRAVGCNGHGQLDADSRNSRVDPFVDGRCECDDEWLAEYDAAVGPYCREATVGEWPSGVLDRSRTVAGERPTIDWRSDSVDSAFRQLIERQRRDGDEPLFVRDPCWPCPTVLADDGRTYFCGDEFRAEDIAPPRIRRAFVGVRRDRDYLHGNGGRLPNECMRVDARDLLTDHLLVQFMSRADGEDGYAMEIGLLLPRDRIAERIPRGGSFDSARYRRFVATLREPRSVLLGLYGVVWTYTAPGMSQHRRTVCESLNAFFRSDARDRAYTDITHDGGSWIRTPFPCAKDDLVVNSYYYLPAGSNVRMLDVLRDKRVQRIRDCPDQTRDLDRWIGGDIGGCGFIETDAETARRMANALAPVCFTPHTDSRTGETYARPNVNCEHPNDTACVLRRPGNFYVALELFWYPTDMRMRTFCSERAPPPPPTSVCDATNADSTTRAVCTISGGSDE